MRQCSIDPVYTLLKSSSRLLLSIHFKVDSHKSLTTFTSKHCWIGVILATTSVIATSGGCRLSTTIGFVSVTSTKSYIAGYYA
jgi:hypothetical protein